MKQPHLLQSFRHAWDGWCHAFRTQRNLRIHVAVGGLVAVLAAWLRLDFVKCSILALTIGAVLACELFNPALEAVIDLLSPEYHARAKVAKDVAAAAVLLLGVTSVVLGLLILGPPLWNLISTSLS